MNVHELGAKNLAKLYHPFVDSLATCLRVISHGSYIPLVYCSLIPLAELHVSLAGYESIFFSYILSLFEKNLNAAFCISFLPSAEWSAGVHCVPKLLENGSSDHTLSQES